METNPSTKRSQFPIHYGPSPAIVAIVFVLLFIISIVISRLLVTGASYSNPYAPADLARDYYLRFADAIRIGAFLQFGAAIPLGIFTATITSRLKFHGINAAGVNIALFGGFSSAVFLAISGLCGFILSQPGIAGETASMRAIQFLGFSTGGLGHVVTMGLLLAGVSVTAGFGKLLPRWLAWMGLILAAISELSSLGIIFPKLFILLPLGRYPAFIWLIATGIKLPKQKKE